MDERGKNELFQGNEAECIKLLGITLGAFARSLAPCQVSRDCGKEGGGSGTY